MEYLSEINKKRWYKLIDHPVQLELLNDDVRFKVVPAGRRSGKTERAKRYIIKQSLKNPNEQYFVAAPTRDQVKKIYWNDLKKLMPESQKAKPPSETELTLHFKNGTVIILIGLDKPERIEGTFWSGGIIDEIADIKEGAWEANISPALDTFNPSRPDYQAWCWLIGVPDGLNHYYDMANYAETANDPQWKLYHWKSSEILPTKTIEAAKRRMSRKQYLQEYEASFETATGRAYEDYSKKNHTDKVYDPDRPIHWCHDFNYTPMSSAIVQEYGDVSYVVDEIILESAVAKNAVMEFVQKYQHAKIKQVFLYGDAAGRAGEKHSQESSWSAIKDILFANNWIVIDKVPYSNMSIMDGQNSLRARILNAMDEVNFFVNPSICKYTDKGLSTTQLKEGSSFQEKDSQYQHITTALRYYTKVRFPLVQTYSTAKLMGI